MLLAILSTEGGGGAEGRVAVGALWPMERANPAKEGMLVAMEFVTLARDGNPSLSTEATSPVQTEQSDKMNK